MYVHMYLCMYLSIVKFQHYEGGMYCTVCSPFQFFFLFFSQLLLGCDDGRECLENLIF